LKEACTGSIEFSPASWRQVAIRTAKAGAAAHIAYGLREA